jgi:predicted CopG family antitoxin
MVVLKRIAISEQNYKELKDLGRAGDSYNDVLNFLLDIARKSKNKAELTISAPATA